jgi:hypothetical protein
MPFDFESLLRERRVHVEPPQAPPQPPERGGDAPRRIHVMIEIVERRPPAKRRHRFGTLTLVLLIIIMLAALAGCTVAHAQTNGPMRYEHWQDTNGWHGEVRRQGRTTDWTDYGPNGQQRHCHTYYVGDQPITSCN